jgi:thiol-disulfide isomerase/thioredoxin
MKRITTLLLAITLLAKLTTYGQIDGNKPTQTVNPDSLAKLEAIVLSNPDDLAAHGRLIKCIGIDNPLLVQKYEKLLEKFPSSPVIPFALGETFANVESPKARPWLLKAVEREPSMAKAYFLLWIDGERWGDFNTSREYLRKAMEAEPKNPDYAFYYRSSFKESDPARYLKGMMEMPLLFPESERGAQALYWLGLFVKELNEKIQIYKQLKDSYPPEKSRWSSSGMYDYYYLCLEHMPDKALELARSMASIQGEGGDTKSWNNRIKLAEDLILIKKLVETGKREEALDAARKVELERRSPATDMLMLLRAYLEDAEGNTVNAYRTLIRYYATTPGDEIREAVQKYGEKLGKSRENVYEDIWKIRDSVAVAATAFSLEQYMEPGKASLPDYRGKVILLTYWFPGCGPCRGEFPYFENVIRKFSKDKVAYIGINISPEQDEYVAPFMKSSGYSFTPLKGESAQQGNLVARGAPTNYLLDQQGRIIFKNFRIDGNNERLLELMIQELLERQ